MEIRESAEDYLEAMLMLQEEKGTIRSVDVAEKLHVSKPSVTYATKRLKENGYITMNSSNVISLTEKGLEIASNMLDRHKTLSVFLMKLGVKPDQALEDACKIEHDLSEESFAAIRRHVNSSLK